VGLMNGDPVRDRRWRGRWTGQRPPPHARRGARPPGDL